MNSSSDELDKVLRGKRIKNIRENELHLNKTQLASKIGISGQFLGLVEDGRGNLVYKSLKKLMEISGHSSDYILFGLDDTIITNTKELLKDFSDVQISEGVELIKQLALYMKNTKEE